MADMPYVLKPLKIGCEALGIDLAKVTAPAIIQQIKKDVTQHRILVFRNQMNLPPEKHLEIGSWFGEIESTFYNHPKSPLRDIFRVSNDPVEGCVNVGRTGWHIDGSFQSAPFSHSIYYIVSVPTSGATSFLPLTELIQGIDQATREKWERLWMVSDGRSGPVHPLIYRHPETGKPVLCFHLGMTESFILDHMEPSARELSTRETQEILHEIQREILKQKENIYHHEYSKGDLIISDNLAVGHEASPQTQLPRDQVGLRVMHRVTIAGKSRPCDHKK